MTLSGGTAADVCDCVCECVDCVRDDFRCACFVLPKPVLIICVCIYVCILRMSIMQKAKGPICYASSFSNDPVSPHPL